MADDICIWFDGDGKAHAYNNEFDVAIHCENEQQMNEAISFDNDACNKRGVSPIEYFNRRAYDEKDESVSKLNSTEKIEVNQAEVDWIISYPKACKNSLFWHYDENSGKYVGIDNTTGEAWTEEFDTKQECFDWLNGKEHSIDIVKSPELLIRIADDTYGMKLEPIEAEMLLGYLEGSDFCLLVDGKAGDDATLLIHDNQRDAENSGDTVFQFLDVIDFCQSANASILDEQKYLRNPSERYVRELRKDNALLSRLEYIAGLIADFNKTEDE